MSIKIGLNRVYVENSTLDDVLQTANARGKNNRLYYKNLCQLGHRIHEKLRSRNECACVVQKTGIAGTGLFPSCLILVEELQDVCRRSNIVVPQEALFLDAESEKSKKRFEKKGARLSKRKLCLIYIREDVEFHRVEIIHCPFVHDISYLVASKILFPSYGSVLGKEVWNAMAKRRAMAVVDKEFSMSGEKKLCWGRDNMYFMKKSPEAWVGINTLAIWRDLAPILGYHNDLLFRGAQPKGDTRPSKRGGQVFNGTLGTQHEYDDTIDYSVLRDYILLNCQGLHGLADFVTDGAEPSGRDETGSPVCLPFDLTCISNLTFEERVDLGHPIERYKFFPRAADGIKYAREHCLPMFAHDTQEGTGKKRFYVPASWFTAYEMIRMRGCMERNIRFSHEYFLPERPIRLFLDLDCSREHNEQYCIDGYKDMIDMDKVDLITRAHVTWFTRFVNRVFGPGTCATEDWVVLCATRAPEKISRHLRLAKDRCFFRSTMDYITFMRLVAQELKKEMYARNKSMDANPESTDPVSWMVRYHEEINFVTKRPQIKAGTLVDFAVVRESGCIRSPFCAKISDPTRVLVPLMDGPSYEPGDEKDFQVFLSSMVTYVSKKHEGWRMPLGVTSYMPSVAMEKKSVMKSLGKGKEGVSDTYNETTEALLSLPIRAWYETSSIPPCTHKDVKAMIDEFLHIETGPDGEQRGAKRKHCFGSVMYSTELIMDPNDCVNTTIRAYFLQHDKERSGCYMKDWGLSGVRLQAERRMYRVDEIRERERARERSNGKQALDAYDDRYSSTVRGRDARHRVEKQRQVGSHRDMYFLRIRDSPWCCIKGGDHKSSGKVAIRFYRSGKVVAACLNSLCEKKVSDTFGERVYYWQLPYVSPDQRKQMWSDEMEENKKE